jgi:hypothetical protein
LSRKGLLTHFIFVIITHIIKQKDGVCQEKTHPKPWLWGCGCFTDEKEEIGQKIEFVRFKNNQNPLDNIRDLVLYYKGC